MANELSLVYGITGKTVYFTLANANGQLWNGSSFEAPTTANWANYKLAGTESSTTGIYLANMPSMSAGLYFVSFWLQIGTTAAPTDLTLADTHPIQWDGSKEGAVDVRSLGGSASALAGVKGMGLAVFSGVVSSDATPTTTGFTANTTSTPGLSTSNQFYSSPAMYVYFTSGADATKGYRISNYTYSAGVGTFTVETMNAAPSANDTFVILGHA